MVAKNLEIILDSSVAVFYSGQPVTGRVAVRLTESKKIRGIRLKLRGEGRVRWEECSKKQDDKGKKSVEDIFEANEVYMDIDVYLLGQSKGEVVVPEGESSYPFSIPLPQNLPPSFEGTYGYVRYFMTATMDVAWQVDLGDRIQLSVVSLLDLNTEQIAKKPIQVNREKFLCCCCCRSGPVSLTLSLPTRGYVPGQDISVTVEVDNNTSSPITDIFCHFTEEMRFHARRPINKTQTTSIKVFKQRFNGVDPNSSRTLVEKIRVPALPPSFLKHCNIIDVSYILTIEAVIKGPHLNLFADADLVIGTIPLLSSCSASTNEPVIGWTVCPSEDPRPAWHSPQPWDPSAYPTIPPPSYEAYRLSQYEHKEAENEDKRLFTPYYPIFSLQS